MTLCCERESDIYYLANLHDVTYDEKYELTRKIIDSGIARHMAIILAYQSDLEDFSINSHYRNVLMKHEIKSESHDQFASSSVDTAEYSYVRNWINIMKFISRILTNEPNSCSSLSDHEISKTILPKVFYLMDAANKQSESKQVMQAVKPFIRDLAREATRMNPVNKVVPILVGSAGDGTACFVPNNINYVFLFEKCSKLEVANIQEVLFTHGKSLQQDSRLKLSRSYLSPKHLSPCLRLETIWSGSIFPDLEIHIDIVPCLSTRRRSIGFHHNYKK